MSTSEKGINLIKSFEGCRLNAYKCPAGVWTIGYGHTAGVIPGQAVTQAQAESWLKSDLVKYEGYVQADVKLPLTQPQFDALVSFSYNCGRGNLRSLVRNRSLSQIADALLLYNKGGGKILAGLVRRRKAERNLFLSEGAADAVQDEKLYYPKCARTQAGIASALKSIGTGSSYAFRSRIASENGITGYKGSATQNRKMLELLKRGKLIRV